MFATPQVYSYCQLWIGLGKGKQAFFYVVSLYNDDMKQLKLVLTQTMRKEGRNRDDCFHLPNTFATATSVTVLKR